MSWFNVDKAGLASILERRGKSFAIFELLQNAWDSGATSVEISLMPQAGVPYCDLMIKDNGEGFSDLEESFTMFARSRRAADPQKRGRFNLGEKLVLAVCKSATIETTCGTIYFQEGGSVRRTKSKLEKGTCFTGEIRMTREEVDEIEHALCNVIPPVRTIFNGHELGISSDKLVRFEIKLPTEIADADGVLRRSTRMTWVEVYDAPNGNGDGMILEMGIPIVESDTGYFINVLQKVPMNLDRDNVQPAFAKALNVAVLNNLHRIMTEEESSSSWAQEAMGDSRASAEAVKTLIVKRFGDRAVVANPSDPIANANCAAAGYTVIPGGTLGSDAWANVRKHQILLPSSKVIPTPRPEEQAAKAAAAQQAGGCPFCGK